MPQVMFDAPMFLHFCLNKKLTLIYYISLLSTYVLRLQEQGVTLNDNLILKNQKKKSDSFQKDGLDVVVLCIYLRQIRSQVQ